MTTRVAGTGERADFAHWLGHGVIGGILAGIIFAGFEMIMATLQMGGEATFMPLRMIGGIVLGEQALAAETPLIVAGGAGVAVHMLLSAAYGAGVGLIAAVVPLLRSGPIALVIWASAAGFALWIVNFYVIAPMAGWRWFPDGTDPVVQFVAHTIVFGSILGLYLDRFARQG
jgi:hypothetical protein